MKSKFERQFKSHLNETLNSECPKIENLSSPSEGRTKVTEIKKARKFSWKNVSHKKIRIATTVAASFIVVFFIGNILFHSFWGVNKASDYEGVGGAQNGPPQVTEDESKHIQITDKPVAYEPVPDEEKEDKNEAPVPAPTTDSQFDSDPNEAPKTDGDSYDRPAEAPMEDAPKTGGFVDDSYWYSDNEPSYVDGSKEIENSFVKTSEETVSTFSIDVDTASYSNIRRFINSGIKPPKEAVRIEEMVNYFSYNYPNPTGEDPFSATTEIGRCPWNDKNYIAMIGLKGKEVATDKLPLSNLVFLIDVSGSMHDDDKLPLLKESFKLLVEQLGENDRVSIVVYAGAAGTVLDGARGNEKDKILSALESLEAGGSTAGAEGVQKAYDLAKKYFIPGGNNRVLLATDGDFNVGISDPDDLKKLIEEKRKAGIFLSVLGFGASGFGDGTMETLADAGNGNYSSIDTKNEAKKVLVEELGGTLLAIAKDVKIQVEFNSNVVAEYRLIGYENRVLNNEDFEDDTKDAGEIGAGHTVTALYEIVPKKDLAKGDKIFDLSLRYKKPDANTSKEIKFVASYKNVETNSQDFQFACAVAEFGQILRESKYKANSSISSVMNRALANKGDDKGGYRKEFIELVKKYEEI